MDQCIISSPQLWPAIAKQFFAEVPEIVALCQPIANPSSCACLSPTSSVDGSDHCDAPPSSSFPATPTQLLQCNAALRQMGMAADLLAGQVGDCCDDEAFGAGHGAGHFDIERLSAPKPTEPGVHSDHSGTSDEQSVRYFGMVVQSRVQSSVEGCYLLKTVQNRAKAGGCHCTHYSLTRVCRGESLHQQLQNSWLV